MPTISEIHTIAKGHLLDHDRAPTCWCGPLQDDVDPRIWHHFGENTEHYPMYQTHPTTGENLTDADGVLLLAKRYECRCGRVMPQGRKGGCLACHTPTDDGVFGIGAEDTLKAAGLVEGRDYQIATKLPPT